MGRRWRSRRVRGVVAVLAFALLFVSSTTAASASVGTKGAQEVTPLMLDRPEHTSTLYVLASVKCPTRVCLRLYRTHDATESTIDPVSSFTRVNLPAVGHLALGATGSLRSMVFATPEIGYITEGTVNSTVLYATFNGAKSWREIPIPTGYDIWSVTPTGPHFYALLVRVSSDRRLEKFEVIRATLSVRHWKGVSLRVTAGINGEFGSLAAYGENVWYLEQTKTTSVLYTSHNGGVSFARSVHPNLSSNSACYLTAVTTKKVWAQCPTGMLSTFHLTNDAGRTWNPFIREAYNNTAGGFFATAGYDFAYVDFGNTPRNIHRVNIGARRDHAIGDFSCTDVESALFMSVSHGYAICAEGSGAVLDRSTDGGATWHKVVLPPA